MTGDVQRIVTVSGSRIEPPMDQSWSNAQKLDWWAAVARADTGLNVRVAESRYWRGPIRQRGYFDVRVGSSSCGPYPYTNAWDYISGLVAGVQAASAWAAS